MFGTNTSANTYSAFRLPNRFSRLAPSRFIGSYRGEFNHLVVLIEPTGSVALRIVYLLSVYMRMFGTNILCMYLLAFWPYQPLGLWAFYSVFRLRPFGSLALRLVGGPNAQCFTANSIRA